jgi:ribosomal protein S18 acetylase RimI-like enzyme
VTTERPIAEGSKANHRAMIETLALAFQDDPAIAWILPDAEARRKALPKLFNIVVPDDHAAGMALRSSADEVVTLWRKPGHPHFSNLETLKLLPRFLGAFGFGIERAIRIGNAVEAHHPKSGAYWYLHYAGVRPEHQGKGWGGAAIRAGIARAKAEGVPALLETATPSNVGLYQNLGFRIISEWDVPRGGPHFWTMMSD